MFYDESYYELAVSVNPFCVRDEKRKMMVFSDWGECYLYTLKRIKELFPRGCIDVPLLIMELTKSSMFTSKRFFKRFKYTETKREMCFIPFGDNEDVNTQKNMIKGLFCDLHSMSGTILSFDYFNYAWDKFINSDV